MCFDDVKYDLPSEALDFVRKLVSGDVTGEIRGYYKVTMAEFACCMDVKY